MNQPQSPSSGWPSPLAVAADAALEATVAPSFSRFGPMARSRLFGWRDAPDRALTGRHALVTGATSGIGAATAEGLARLGATVHLVGRDSEKLDATIAEVRTAVPGAQVDAELADFARLADVGALADRIAARLDRLDVLANVAGALVHEEEHTPDGYELTVQVHVIAPFLLTRALLALLGESGQGRVLTMSSGGMYTERLDVAALLQPTGTFDGTTTYARAKRAQVELNAEWSRRHRADGVAFHAMHPGWVDTPGLRAGLPGFARWMRPILRSPRQGADTAIWLSWTDAAPAPGGEFWLDRRPRHTTVLPWTRTPEGEADRLWHSVSGAAVAP